ncbi:MAG TPA: putative molybdenum carrier protein [Pirellulaceae bacterium]|nr:putative molybdenum carrier protein [Pirellulaceae bacterium]
MPRTSTAAPRRKILRLARIVSGGQTGVDRAALDAAIALEIPHGGWCPRGRLAEDGPIDARYELSETEQTDYRFRTECNVVDSDGTLLIYHRHLTGGTGLTYELTQRYQRPCFLVDVAKRVSLPLILGWLKEHFIETLNVAGPRESTQRGIYRRSYRLMSELLANVPKRRRRVRESIRGNQRR